jgi:hypothetical protein
MSTKNVDAEKRRHDRELRGLRYAERLLEKKRPVVEVIKNHSPGFKSNVSVDSGPVSAQDILRNVPKEKWHDLIPARRP